MKLIKFIGVAAIVVVATFFVLPYFFKDKIQNATEEELRSVLNAKVSLEDFSLGFFSNFPNATLSLDDFRIIGVDEFENDTLLQVGKLDVVINLSSLFEDAYEIRKINIIRPVANAKILANGKANWDIVVSDTTNQEEDTEDGAPIKLDLRSFYIQDLCATYDNMQDSLFAAIDGVTLNLAGNIELDLKTLANIDDLNLIVNRVLYEDRTTGNTMATLRNADFKFKGKVGDSISKLKLLLNIDTTNVSMSGIPYLSNAKIDADIDMEADLDANKYTFAENTIKLNEIEANFDGFIHLVDSSSVDMDVNVNTPKIDFKQILSLIPAIYAKDFESIQTSGKVGLSAHAKGVMVGDTLPNIDARLSVSDAMFKYPDLPSSVNDINIDARVTNPGAATDSTVIDVSKFSFKMAGNPFSVLLNLKTPVSDPEFNVSANGTIELGSIQQVVHLDSMGLKGVLNAALKANGKMSYVDQGKYELFNVDGKLDLSDFILKMTGLNYDVTVRNASFDFSSQQVNMDAKVGLGESDLSLTGNLQNFIQYVMRGETIKGALTVRSNLIDTNELLGETADEETQEDAAGGSVNIPSNIDFAMNVSVDKLVYDKINLNSLKGNLHVKDAVANINSLTASTMGGTVSVNGNYDTRDTLNPKAAVKMNVNKMSISEVFSTVRTAKRMVPLLSDASGEFTMEMDFSSAMDATLSPIMNTINAKGRMSSKEVTLKNVEVFNNIAETAKFNALKDPKLKNINIAFSIKDGRLYADPFETMISSALMNVSGSSGLDKTLDYTAKLTLPQNVSSAVDLAFDILIGGTFTKPTIKMSAASILNQVKEKVVEKIDEAKQKAVAEATAQKEKLIKTAKEQKAMLVSKAQQSADKAIEKAQKESDNLVAKAANPIAKAAAKKSGEVMIKKARTEADKMIKDAESQGDKLVKDAESQGDEMIKKASQTSIKQ